MWRRSAIAAAVLASAVKPGMAQEALPAERAQVTSTVTVTTKGISLIPSFTLGRPAAILDVAIRKHGFGFEPQLRMALDGKPWSFLFWGRYRPRLSGKLSLVLGAHPALAFRTTTVTTSTGREETITAQRYLAGEVSPMYAFGKGVSAGGYYLYSHGVEPSSTRRTQFLAGRLNVADVRLGRAVQLQLAPQLYYLRTDDVDGVYFSSTFTLTGRGLPFSVSSIVNKPLRTHIARGQDFLWNVSLVYAVR